MGPNQSVVPKWEIASQGSQITQLFLQQVRSTLEDGKVLRNALQLFEESWSQDDPARTKEANRIDREITKTKSAIDRYLLVFEEGTMPVQGCGHRIQELTEKLTGLESRKAEIDLEASQPRDLPKIEEVKDGAQKVIAMIEQFQGDQVPSLKELLRKLLPQIEVENGSTVYPVIHLPMVLINSDWVDPSAVEPLTNGLFLDSSPLTLSSRKRGAESVLPARVEPALRLCLGVFVRGQPFGLSTFRQRRRLKERLRLGLARR